MPDDNILNRRLKVGNSFVYPITDQANVIGLQKTIKEKMPIVSENEPVNVVENQVWIELNTGGEEWHRVSEEQEEWHKIPEPPANNTF